MRLSVVTTLYRSRAHVNEFYRRMSEAARSIAEDYEIVFVNDGSPDDSLALAVELHKADSRVSVIDLSRNFGHHKAIMTGLAHAQGDRVFLINCDLEEAPENLVLFDRRFSEEADCDVVYGSLEARRGHFLGRMLGEGFYSLFNLLTEGRVNIRVAFSRLMSRRYVRSLVEFQEREVFLPGIWYLTGYRQVAMPIQRHFKGESSYTLKKRISLAVNAITSFSSLPLILISYTGFAISIISGLAILYLVYQKMFRQVMLSGWTSLIVSVWFVGGLIILFLGIIGTYLSKIFVESKNRPYTIIRQLYRHNNQGKQTDAG